MKYEEVNTFTLDHFPEHWDGGDIAFLSEFVHEEFRARLFRDLNGDDWDYTLFRRVPRDE